MEDSFSSELNEDLLRCYLPFVFGQAWVFQRSKLSSPGPGNWNHHTPINLHQSLSLSEVFDLKFRVEDMVLVNGELVIFTLIIMKKLPVNWGLSLSQIFIRFVQMIWEKIGALLDYFCRNQRLPLGL